MSKAPIQLDAKHVAAISAGLIVVDVRGKITYVNAAAEQTLGKSAADLLGKKSWNAFFDKRGPTLFDAVFDEESGIAGEVHLASGDHVWVSVEPTFDDDGEVDGAVACVSAAPAVAAEDETYQPAVVAATSQIMVADKDFNITYANPAALEMFGNAEADIKEVLPHFDINKVIGSNIDIFHKDPSHQRRLVGALQNTYKGEINVGKRIFQVIATPTFNSAGERQGTVVEWQDLTADRADERERQALAEKSARIGAALDKTSTNIMISDADYNIIYMNDAVQEMMARNAHELGKLIPGFDATNLVGQNIDVFHRDPSHQRRVLDKLTTQYAAKLNLGELHFQIVANPVFDAQGQRQGTIVEWEDQTERVKAAEEREAVQAKIQADAEELQRKVDVILEVVQSAVRGDFSCDVPNLGDDAVGQLGKGVAGMIGAVKAVVAEIQEVIAAAKGGRLDHRADASQFQGGFADVISGVNDTVDALMEPVSMAQDVLERLANYDLRARVEAQFEGDHNRLKDSLNQSGDVLHTAISQVAEAVDQILSASDQIAKSSQEVADGASTQASSLEETSASLEEMSGMTKLNADNAQQADAMAKAAQDAAGKGSEAMGSMNESMGKIRQASEDTSAIIKDINEIAFQTNLLALNAAVEAARAGDAGRGFAVVAEEVRNLAQRSKEAAQKTETLINQSVKLAEDGGRITNEATERLDEITDSIAKVTALVGEIASASSEQARGIEQINTAVTSMDRVTQGNASASEESSSAAEELAAQAKELQSMVGRFKLEGDNSAPARSSGIRVTMKPKVSSARPVSNGHTVRPQDLIPLDDDPDFAEF